MTSQLWRPVDLVSEREQSLGARGLTSFLGLIAQGLVRLAVTVVVGRFAGKYVLGVVAGGMASAQFLILFWPTTSGQAASRFLARARGRGDVGELYAAARHLRSRFLLATAVLSLASVPISLARGTGALGAVCIALFLWGVAGQQFTRGVHYGVGAVYRVVVLDVALSFLGLLGVVVALWAGVRDLVLLLPLTLAYLVLTISCWPWSRNAARADRALRREIDHFVLFGSWGTIASAGLVQLSVLAAERLGTAEAGQYAAASNLAIPLTLISGALSLVLYPSMAEAFGRGDEVTVRRQLDVGVRGLIFAVTPIAASGALVAPELVRVLFGPNFSGSAGILSILLLAITTTMIAVPCVNAMTSAGRNGIVVMAVASFAGLVLAVLVWVAVTPHWGALGVAAGYAVGVGSTALFAIVRSWVKWGLAWIRPMLGFGLFAGLAATSVVLTEGGPLGLRAAIAALLAVAWALVMVAERRLWLSAIRDRRG